MELQQRRRKSSRLNREAGPHPQADSELLKTLPEPVLENVMSRLDPASAAAARQACKALRLYMDRSMPCVTLSGESICRLGAMDMQLPALRFILESTSQVAAAKRALGSMVFPGLRCLSLISNKSFRAWYQPLVFDEETIDIEIFNTRGMESLSFLRRVSGLQQLQLLGWNKIRSLDPLMCLRGLSNLKLGLFSKWPSNTVHVISQLTSLTRLYMVLCDTLETASQPLSALSVLTGLRELGLLWFSGPVEQDVGGLLAHLRGLSSLTLTGGIVDDAAHLTVLSTLSSLRSLKTVYSDLIMAAHTNITSLDTSGFFADDAMPAVMARLALPDPPLRNLRTLCMKNSSVGDIGALAVLAGSLRSLDMSHCYQVSSMEPLSTLVALTDLNVDGCDMGGFPGPADPRKVLSPLTCVRRLSMLGSTRSGGRDLQGIGKVLAKLRALEELRVDRCRDRVLLKQLSALTRMQRLTVPCPGFWCRGSAPPLAPLASKLQCLRVLTLVGARWNEALEALTQEPGANVTVLIEDGRLRMVNGKW